MPSISFLKTSQLNARFTQALEEAKALLAQYTDREQEGQPS